MSFKKIILIPIFFISSFCEGNSLKEIEQKFSVEIIIDNSFQGTWESVSYKKVIDTVRIENYLNILLIEYSKYPVGYLNKASVRKIIICDSLIINGQKRAAIPDPYKNALYLVSLRKGFILEKNMHF